MKEISKKQKETLEFITEFIGTNVQAPTMQNIADHFGIEVGAAHWLIQKLHERGYITSVEHQPRSISLTDKAFRFQI